MSSPYASMAGEPASPPGAPWPCSVHRDNPGYKTSRTPDAGRDFGSLSGLTGCGRSIERVRARRNTLWPRRPGARSAPIAASFEFQTWTVIIRSTALEKRPMPADMEAVERRPKCHRGTWANHAAARQQGVRPVSKATNWPMWRYCRSACAADSESGRTRNLKDKT